MVARVCPSSSPSVCAQYDFEDYDEDTDVEVVNQRIKIINQVDGGSRVSDVRLRLTNHRCGGGGAGAV